MPNESMPAYDHNFFARQLSQNATVYVRRPDEGEGVRHCGILIGNQRDEFLLIGVLDGSAFGAGDSMIVRMGLGPHLVGFESRIFKKMDDPTLYLIEFPHKIAAMNLRKAQRLQAFFPADVKVEKPPSRDVMLLQTRVLDISAGGCSFRSKTKSPSDAAAQISFSLPGERHIQSLKASVIDSSPVGTVYHSRAKFLAEPTNLPNLQEIAKWVSEGLSYAAGTA
jgi:hypothetical protein